MISTSELEDCVLKRHNVAKSAIKTKKQFFIFDFEAEKNVSAKIADRGGCYPVNSVREIRKIKDFKCSNYQNCGGIEQIWLQTMIPVICRRAIEYRLKTLESRYSSLLKSKYGKNSQYFESMVQQFNAETSNNLFVISLCTCKEINDCKCRRNCKIH